MKTLNEYVGTLGTLYSKTPKAVFAAIAVSTLTCGGDELDKARARLLEEWRILHQAGIVPQAPPKRVDLQIKTPNGRRMSVKQYIALHAAQLARSADGTAACEYGHFDCACWEGGPCTDELGGPE